LPATGTETSQPEPEKTPAGDGNHHLRYAEYAPGVLDTDTRGGGAAGGCIQNPPVDVCRRWKRTFRWAVHAIMPGGNMRMMGSDQAVAEATPFRAKRHVSSSPSNPAPDARYRSAQMAAVSVQRIRASGIGGGDLMLLRIAPGSKLPLHSHRGNELTMILDGAYDDMLGHFGPGDVADLDGETNHQPVTSPGVPCICVAATDAPLKFSGWVARTLQPLLGF